jgi:UDP-N-acetylglucosamine transferase subunit ALG13
LALAGRLRAEGDRISWASSGPAAAMLRRELPGEAIHELPPYRVTYPSKRMGWNVARQAWHWRRTIRGERRRCRELVEELGVDRIVSDSRFGCYVRGVPGIFLTHQLHPITHFAPASALYNWHLRRFDEFWVPDHASPDRLSGKLSSRQGYDRVSYIGPLSRLRPRPGIVEPYEMLVLLSGPEPMRTRLEQLIIAQLPAETKGVKIVRGLPKSAPPLRWADGEVLAYADTPTLAALITSARYVVARSGYSTLMDLRALHKPAILIPTPGQTEQQYLAQRAKLQGWAVAVPDQELLDLTAARRRIRDLISATPPVPPA